MLGEARQRWLGEAQHESCASLAPPHGSAAGTRCSGTCLQCCTLPSMVLVTCWQGSLLLTLPPHHPASTSSRLHALLAHPNQAGCWGLQPTAADAKTDTHSPLQRLVHVMPVQEAAVGWADYLRVAMACWCYCCCCPGVRPIKGRSWNARERNSCVWVCLDTRTSAGRLGGGGVHC